MSVTMHAQQTWSISHQKKTVLKNVSEDPDNNVISISKALWTLQVFVITFKAWYDLYKGYGLWYVRNGLKNWDDVKKAISIPNTIKISDGGKNKSICFSEIPKKIRKKLLLSG